MPLETLQKQIKDCIKLYLHEWKQMAEMVISNVQLFISNVQLLLNNILSVYITDLCSHDMEYRLWQKRDIRKVYQFPFNNLSFCSHEIRFNSIVLQSIA